MTRLQAFAERLASEVVNAIRVEMVPALQSGRETDADYERAAAAARAVAERMLREFAHELIEHANIVGITDSVDDDSWLDEPES